MLAANNSSHPDHLTILTKRGVINITDTHVFDIEIGKDFQHPEQVTITIGGKTFRIKSLLDASNEVGYDGGERTAC
jgi:hypothetical protein